MAKKKKQKPSNSSVKEYRPSVISQRKEIVQRIYNISAREIRQRIPNQSRLKDGMDFDPIRTKRRVSATVASIDELERQIAGICEDVPEIFSVAEDWARANSIAAPAYDCEEEDTTATLGAAIWILDQIREGDRIRDAIRLMPKDDGPLDNIIQYRNSDCVGAKQFSSKPGDSESLARFHMDTLTAEGKHKQQVNSRIRFETILSLIPDAAKEKAVRHYPELYWEWVRRYYRCRSIYVQKEIQLEKDTKDFYGHLRSGADSVMNRHNALKKNPPKLDAISFPPQGFPSGLTAPLDTPMAELFRLTARMEAEEALLNKRSDEIEEALSILHSDLRYSHTSSFLDIEKELRPEIAGIWRDFEVDDPYEFCFAHLYLLDSGSDLPWLYYPGVSLFARAACSLPWAHCDYDDECDGIWSHWDPASQRGSAACACRLAQLC